jgi:hypothetical protein
MLSLPTTSIILDSENLGINTTNRPHGTMSILKTYLIMLAQVLTTLDLIIEGSQEVEFSNHPKQDKWVV